MTEQDQEDRPFRIKTDIGGPVLKTTLGLTRGLLEHSLRLPDIEQIYRDGKAVDENICFASKVLKAMDLDYRISDEDWKRIPREGPVVVVANHPFGGIEGLVLISLLQSVRPDVKVMANYMLARIPELREAFFFVDPFGTAASSRENMRPMKQCLKWLRDGHLLAAFPAGEVSSVDLKTGTVRDPAWSPTLASFARRTQATVVPVFFAGQNGPLFQLAGMVHPRFRTMMLPRQVLNKRHQTLDVRIGAPLRWQELKQYESDAALIKYLRLRTYLLGEREATQPKRFSWPPVRRRGRRPAPLAGAVPVALLAEDIEALPDEAQLLASGDYDVYCAPAHLLPAVLREIGRLREVTFRAVGEGTGKPMDLDRFDDTYQHLFIWNRAKQEIVGAYRLGLADQLARQFGQRGLYTHTLFRFNARLLEQLQPAIELGRSFVRPEYQKAYSSLLLLWKGIGAFIAAHPHYRGLFGPVSITNEYRDASRNLLLRSLRLSNFAPELARFVKPRRAPRHERGKEWDAPDMGNCLDDLRQVSAMIQDIEADHKGIPILLKQYLKLGGRVLAFNVDPSFSSVVDGLISMDLTETDPRALRRYMGEESATVFMRHHGIQ